MNITSLSQTAVLSIMETSTLNVAIVPTPGMGHLIPLVELAKRLVHHHNFSITFIVPSDGSPMKSQKKLLQSLSENKISSIFLPPVSFDDLPPDAPIEARITLSLTRSLGAFKDSFENLCECNRVVALIVDIFGTEAFAVGREFGVPPYVFVATPGMTLSFIFEFPKLDAMYSCQFRDLTEPIHLPGCVPVRGIDFSDMVQDRKNEVYASALHICNQYPLAAGILVNSSMDIEPGVFKALAEVKPSLPPIYPVGPLTQSGESSSGDDRSGCLQWLDSQPNGSVLFVSFGSGGTLSQEQTNELALGLEMSGQRFLWVVRPPSDKVNAAYFEANGADEDLSRFLPNGFLDRTRDVGLVVLNWAPQIEVMAHGSTGGFLTHCGWNSTLEAIVNGVPLIAWPLYAEQKMNAVLLADDLNVAIRVKIGENGLVGRDDIAKYVNGLMEGKEGNTLRSKMRNLKDGASRALSQEGSSTKSLAQVAEIWKNQKK